MRIAIHRVRRWIIGRAYSQDLRDWIVGYVGQGHSARAAGRVFGVSARASAHLIESEGIPKSALI